MSRVFAILVGLFLLDRAVKYVVATFLPPEGASPVGGVLVLEAFPSRALVGALELPATLATTIIAALVAALAVTFTLSLRAHRTRQTLGFGLILAGALSNLLDRLQWGYVLDYLRLAPFPLSLNLSDLLILAGLLAVLLTPLPGREFGQGA